MQVSCFVPFIENPRVEPYGWVERRPLKKPALARGPHLAKSPVRVGLELRKLTNVKPEVVGQALECGRQRR